MWPEAASLEAGNLAAQGHVAKRVFQRPFQLGRQFADREGRDIGTIGQGVRHVVSLTPSVDFVRYLVMISVP